MTRLEQFVSNKLLSRLLPRTASDINLWALATRLGVEVQLYPVPSHLFGTDESPTILLDSRTSEDEQREELAHEICHYIAHAGNHLKSDDWRINVDESQAKRMSMYLLCPTQMLADVIDGMAFQDDDEATAFIASEFNIPIALAKCRLSLFKSEQRTMPVLGRDYDVVWEHPCSGRRFYFKNGHLAFAH